MIVYYIFVVLSMYNIVTFIITLNFQNILSTKCSHYLHFIDECGSRKSTNLLQLKW